MVAPTKAMKRLGGMGAYNSNGDTLRALCDGGIRGAS
jgi:hypothetical protein